MAEIKMNYTDAKGETSDYHGELRAEFGDYFRLLTLQGHRTFRKDRVNHYIKGAEALDEPQALRDYTVPKPQRRTSSYNPDRRPEICFTGFAKADKARLEALATAAGFYPTKKTVTVHLLALCCGPRAGVKKIEKATEQGCLILNESELIQLIETGEIPGD